jgi:hypothetical protein
MVAWYSLGSSTLLRRLVLTVEHLLDEYGSLGDVLVNGESLAVGSL